MITFQEFISEANRYEKEFAKGVSRKARAGGMPESEIKKQMMLRQKELTHKMRNNSSNPFLSPKREAENAVRDYQKTTKGLKGENIAFKDGKPVQYNPTTARQKETQGVKGSKKSLYEPTKITSKSNKFRLTPNRGTARTSIDGTMRALHQSNFPMTKGNTPFSDLKGGKYTTANIPKGKIPNPPFKMPKIKTSAVKIAKGTANTAKPFKIPKLKTSAIKIAKGTANTAKGFGLGIAAVAVERGINYAVDKGINKLTGGAVERGKKNLADRKKNPEKYERTLTGYRLKGSGGKNMTLTQFRNKRDEALRGRKK